MQKDTCLFLSLANTPRAPPLHFDHPQMIVHKADLSPPPSSEATAAQNRQNRKLEIRKKLSAERKEKRHAKAEAKRARKANVQPKAKWTPERKAEMKAKKALNQPTKMQKKMERLPMRAEKLRLQAQSLLDQAKKVELQYEQMMKVRSLSRIEPYPFSRIGGRLTLLTGSCEEKAAGGDCRAEGRKWPRPCERLRFNF